jgi:hypothetical protein
MTEDSMVTEARSEVAPRVANLILGVWLFISAFLWPHSQAQMTNTWIVGVLAVVFSLISMYAAPQARYLNTILSIWLFVSAWALPRVSVGTMWNNAIVAILMFIFSLTARRSMRTLRRAPAT